MPVTTTYPLSFEGAPSRTILEQGWILERHQAYAQLPVSAVASVPLLDVATNVQISIPSSTTISRQFVSAVGAIFCGAVTMAAAGCLKVGAAANDDQTIGATTLGAATRNQDLTPLVGTSLPVGSQLMSAHKPGTMTEMTANWTPVLLGSSLVTGSGVAVNISSSSASRPAIILMSFLTLLRDTSRPNHGEWQVLPRAIKELLMLP